MLDARLEFRPDDIQPSPGPNAVRSDGDEPIASNADSLVSGTTHHVEGLSVGNYGGTILHDMQLIVSHMARPSRWSDERKANREQADWIVKWLQANGPATTMDIVAALEEEGRAVQAHVLQRALRRSPFVHKVGTVDGPRGPLSRWMFSVDDDLTDASS